MSALHDLTALEQSAAIRAREISCRELTEHYLQRSEVVGPQVGAFISLQAEAALERADALDQNLIGAGDPESLGPLYGTVIPVKDLDLVAGVPCTFGSKAYRDFVAPADATFVTRLKAAGAVITGKTNTPEFGFPCYTENDIAPPARSPWDLSQSAGGSSGGAAAAVAAGLCSVAQGSDGGGSIRIPASVTGLVGIKPARGRTTAAPLVEPVGELAAIGPLGRTVRDAAALLDVLAGPALGDPFPPAPLPTGGFLAAADTPPGRLRIGRFSTPMIADTAVDDACMAAYETATALLVDLGHEVTDVPAPYGPEVVSSFEAVWTVGAASIPLGPDTVDQILPLTAWLRRRGQAVSGAELAAAVSSMRSVSRQAIVGLADYDVVLTPALAKPSVPVGGLRDDADPAAGFQAQKEFTPFTAPFNVSGQPAMSLPISQTPEGFPVAVQIVGRPSDEATLISLAAQIEASVPWAQRRPAMWA